MRMEKNGGNDAMRARVICPFYHRHAKQKRAIVCEGLMPETETAMIFDSREQMERYSQKRCETYAYDRCLMARCIRLKIEIQEKKAGG